MLSLTSPTWNSLDELSSRVAFVFPLGCIMGLMALIFKRELINICQLNYYESYCVDRITSKINISYNLICLGGGGKKWTFHAVKVWFFLEGER